MSVFQNAIYDIGSVKRSVNHAYMTYVNFFYCVNLGIEFKLEKKINKLVRVTVLP